MPYKVVTLTTPLWADHQRTKKKGKVLFGTEFVCTEAFQDMLKTGSVSYTTQADDKQAVGDGWLEAKNCASANLTDDTGTSTTGGVPVVFGKRKFVITVEEVE